MNEINTKSVSKAAGWSLLTEISLKLVSPITNMILARLLLPSAFGLVATITIVTSFADVLTDAGFQKYIIQHEFDSDDAFEKSFCVALFSNIILSAVIISVIFAFQKPIAVLVGAPELSRAIAVSSIPILFNSYSSIQIAAYKRFFDFKTLFNIRILMAFLPIVTTVPLAFYLKSFWALVIGGLICSAAQFVLFLIKPKVKVVRFYSFGLFRKMFSFSFWTLLESLTIWLTSNVDIFIVGKALNDHYLGIYKTSMSTVSSFMNVISAAVIPVLFSTLSRYQNDDIKFKKAFFDFQKILSIFLIPMGFGIFLFRELATYIYLGESWSEAADFIGVYSIAASVRIIICYFASEVFRSKGQPRISMIYQWIFIIFFVPFITSASKRSFEVLCMLRSLSAIVFALLALAFLHILYKIKIFEIIRNLFPQTISSLIMLVSGSFLKPYFQSLPLQIILIVICVIIYFGILMLFKSTRTLLYKKEYLQVIKSGRKGD